MSDSIRTVADLQGRHLGRRCFILGTGPSMAEVDLATLGASSEDITVGVNKIWRMYIPNYWVSLERREVVAVATQRGLLAESITRLISQRHRAMFKRGRPELSLEALVSFEHDPLADLGTELPKLAGHRTSTALALSLAVLLGCRDIVLLGMDCSFTVAGRHFYGETVDFTNGGVRDLGGGLYTSVDLEAIRTYLEDHIEILKGRDIRVRDATPGGRLRIDRVKYEDLFENSPATRRGVH